MRRRLWPSTGVYLAVQAEAHDASVWTERFGAVAAYIKAQRAK